MSIEFNRKEFEIFKSACQDFDNGKLEDSLYKINFIFKDRPYNSKAYLLSAKIKYSKNDKIGALSDALSAYSLNSDLDSNLVLAEIFLSLKKYDKCIEHANAAFKIDARNHNVLSVLASAYRHIGDIERSIPMRILARDVANDVPQMHHNLLLDLIYSETVDVRDIKKHAIKFDRSIKIRADVYKAKRKIWDNRKIKIAFLSPDFKSHSAAYFLMPLISNIDRDKFEVYLYSLVKKVEYDATTRRFIAISDNFIDLTLHTDPIKKIKRIRDDNLDAIIDVAGHTANTGLSLLKSRLASIQMTWLGYPGTTGVTNVDWRISDIHAEGVNKIPREDVIAQYTEKLCLLNKNFSVYRPWVRNDLFRYSKKYSIKNTPALNNNYVTFGCCNNTSKISDFILGVWSKILRIIEGSRLLIEVQFEQNEYAGQHFMQRLNNAGIDPDSVIIVKRDSINQYLTYNKIDIVLDTYPLNGGTTTFDGLWMSVPTITLRGREFRSQMGASILTNLGRSDWICDTPDQYIEVAKLLARDIAKLNNIRKNLRRKMIHSPLMDEEGYAIQFETAIHEMLKLYNECVSEDIIFISDEMCSKSKYNRGRFIFDENGVRIPIKDGLIELDNLVNKINAGSVLNNLQVIEAVNLATNVLKTDSRSAFAIYCLALLERNYGSKNNAIHYMYTCIDFAPNLKELYKKLIDWCVEDGQINLADRIKENLRLM